MSTDGVRPLDDLNREELIAIAESLERQIEAIRKSDAALRRLFSGRACRVRRLSLSPDGVWLPVH